MDLQLNVVKEGNLMRKTDSGCEGDMQNDFRWTYRLKQHLHYCLIVEQSQVSRLQIRDIHKLHQI